MISLTISFRNIVYNFFLMHKLTNIKYYYSLLIIILLLSFKFDEKNMLPIFYLFNFSLINKI